ncbi:MAG: hypothetical protein MH204_11165 [Fimbriimonadaceae bacterium]|nr:hypothetical protein [Fimbriimonadaceae bacterium]
MTKKAKVILALSIVGVCGFGGCGVLGFIGFMTAGDVAAAEAGLEAQYARSIELGLPVTAEQLRPPVPAAENGAEGFAPALLDWAEKREALLGEAPPKFEEMLAKPRPPEIAKLDDPFLADLAVRLQRPAFQFERDWDLGPELLFPEFAPLRDASKALGWRSVNRARAGNVDGALEDLRIGFRLAGAIGQEPTLIAQLVAVAVAGQTQTGAVAVSEEIKDRPADLDRLADLLQKSAHQADPYLACRGEFYVGLALLRNLDPGNETDPRAVVEKVLEPKKPLDPATLRRDGLPENKLLRVFLSRHLELWNEALSGDPKDRIDVINRTVKMGRDAEKKRTASFILSAILMPTFSQAGTHFRALDTRNEKVVAGVWIMAWRARNGRLPASLEEAGLEVIDNYGRPVRFAEESGSFALYSVGEDGRDDGPKFDVRLWTNREQGDDFGLTWMPARP